jgi:hypothetical protein
MAEPGTRLQKAVKKLNKKSEVSGDVDFIKQSDYANELAELKLPEYKTRVQNKISGLLRKSLKHHKIKNRQGCLFFKSGYSKLNPTELELIECELIVGKEKVSQKIEYEEPCCMCRSKIVLKSSKKGQKIWRKANFLSLNYTGMVGAMITKTFLNISAHQLCLDYAYGKQIISIILHARGGWSNLSLARVKH